MNEWKDSDGNEIDLYRLINKGPKWAVNIIEKLQAENKALKEVEKKYKTLKAKNLLLFERYSTLGEIKDETSELLACERVKNIKIEAENKALKSPEGSKLND